MRGKKKLGTRLIVAFLLVGFVPLAVISGLSLYTATGALSEKSFNQLQSMREIKREQIERYMTGRRNDLEVLTETVGTLRSEAVAKLSAVRQVKSSAVQRYFQTVYDQMVTFSEDTMVVEAMEDFGKTFRSFREDNRMTFDDLGAARKKVREYYNGQFGAEYASQNGHAVDADALLDQLDEDSIALQYYYIAMNKHPLGSKHLLDRSDDQSSYSTVHERFHPIIRSFLEKFGYYDIFLVDPETGDIVYSVFKELDYSTSLLDGPYAQTNFGEAFRKANAATDKDTVVLVDYAQYLPSYDSPASFIASPIFKDGVKIGVAMFQMPIDRLNEIMAERDGMGETGEMYLVGPDHLLRSDCHLDQENRTVVQSFRRPGSGSVDTMAVDKALEGETGTALYASYSGNTVLSAYTPVEIQNFRWALIAEIDVAEAFCPAKQRADMDTHFFAKYINLYGYYDFFLFTPDGYCFYTVAQEADYQTNLLTGPYSDTNLGKAVRTAIDTKAFSFADFSPYAPSNDDPAAFIAQPVLFDDTVELVVALQLPLDGINTIMQERDGMGQTGETYLVGPDNLMRSDSYLDPEGHSVIASFANPKTGSVDTVATRQALTGRTDEQIIIDYNGNPVLSAYSPVEIFDTTWALMAEIDEWEAFDAISNLKLLIGLTAIIGLVAIVLIALTYTRSITRPINKVITDLTLSSTEVSKAVSAITTSSTAMKNGAEEQTSSLENTTSALEEMTALSHRSVENARNAESMAAQTNTITTEGTSAVGRMSEAMDRIKVSSDETAKIVRTIDEIAFQTNLLALNAAVEAARAGDAGKGFAVVAEEVRNLAQRSADAAKDTTELIEQALSNANAGVTVSNEVNDLLHSISNNVEKITGTIQSLASTAAEQSQGIEHVNNSVDEIRDVNQRNTTSLEQSNEASEALSAQTHQLEALVQTLVGIVGTSASERKAPPRALITAEHDTDRQSQ